MIADGMPWAKRSPRHLPFSRVRPLACSFNTHGQKNDTKRPENNPSECHPIGERMPADNTWERWERGQLLTLDICVICQELTPYAPCALVFPFQSRLAVPPRVVEGFPGGGPE